MHDVKIKVKPHASTSDSFNQLKNRGKNGTTIKAEVNVDKGASWDRCKGAVWPVAPAHTQA